MAKIVVSILHYNNPSDTIECLNSLEGSDLNGLELLVFILDNGSKEKLKIDTSKYEKFKTTIERIEKNLGFTGGHNYIFEKTKDQGEYFLLLNNDSLLEKSCLQELVRELVGNIAGVVPKIYFTKGREYHKSRYKKEDLGKVIWYAGGDIDWGNVVSEHRGLDEVDHGQFDRNDNISFATGACLLLKCDTLKKTGLFDQKYFLYYEDAELSTRLIVNGYELRYVYKAVLWHNNAGSSGSGSDLHDYYLTRNKLLFGMKYASVKTKAHLLKEAIRIGFSGRKWQRVAIKDYFLKKFGKGSYDA